MKVEAKLFFASQAWVSGAWAKDVLLGVAASGSWSQITPNAPAQARVGATHLNGPVLPGVVNAHSHAFQRAFAGLAERRESQADDFWSWRDRMYRVALRITPGQLQAIVDQDIFVISALAGLTELAVQFLGDGLVGVTQALARVVAHLTGSGVIAPTDPPLPAPPAGALQLLPVAVLA